MPITIPADVSGIIFDMRWAYIHGYQGAQAQQERIDWTLVYPTASRAAVTGLNASADYVAHTAGQPIATRKMESGYPAVFTDEQYETGVAIEGGARGQIDPMAWVTFYASLGEAGARRLVQSVFDTLNDGFSVLAGDGVALFSANHPSGIGVQSNTGATALDHDGLMAAWLAMQSLRGHDGQRVGHTASHLLVPPALAKAAYQVTGAEFDAADDRRAISFVGNLGVTWQASRFLTAAGKWFLLSREAISSRTLRMGVRRGPQPVMQLIAGTVDDMSVLDVTRWERGAVTWRGLAGYGS